MAKDTNLLAMTPMNNLYIQLMSAMGLKLETSLASPFLWMRIVTEDFQSAGTSFSSRQRLNMVVRILHFGSTVRKCRYSCDQHQERS